MRDNSKTNGLSDYERGFRDAQEQAAQKLADAHDQFHRKCAEVEVGLHTQNEAFRMILLGILAPIQNDIRELKP